MKKLFECGNPDVSGNRNVIDAIRLRKTIDGLSRADMEEIQKLFKKHRFKSAVFETRSHIVEYNDYRERINQLDITNAYKESDEGHDINGLRMGLSYRTRDERYEGSPNIVSILAYSGRDSFLGGGDLRILEDLASVF